MADATTPAHPDLARYERVVRHAVTPFLSEPEALELRSERTRAGWAVQLKVSDDDMGRVIGRGGGTIQAIRSVVEFAARPHGHVVAVDVVDD